MSDNLSKTVHGDFDAVFREVTQSCPVSWITQGELRLFHLNIRNNKFNPEEMKKLLYRNIGDYVFSRAKIEHFKVTGDAFAIVSQALRVLQKNGGADIKGTGSEVTVFIFRGKTKSTKAYESGGAFYRCKAVCKLL